VDCTNCDAGFHSDEGAASCFPDTDADGIADSDDNGPNVFNPDPFDVDGDGIGDVCDNCIETTNSDQVDIDGDGIGDACDACPSIPDPNCATCGNGKYLVCHIPAGNPNNAQQLCLPLNAANAHVGNHGGCYLGLCNSGTNAMAGNRGVQLHESHEPVHLGGNSNSIVETPGGAAYFFEIAPNPANSSVNIHLHGHEAGAHLYIRDQLGRLVWNQSLDAAESIFNISLERNRFADGIYSVSILNNGENITKRLVVVK
jgi:hypothetical protein